MPEKGRVAGSLAAAKTDDASGRWRRFPKRSAPAYIRHFTIAPPFGAPDRPASPSKGWSRALAAFWTAVLAVAGAKVAAAGWGVWGVFVSAEVTLRPFGVTLLLFGLTGALLMAGGTSDRRVRSLGAFFVLVASAFANPLLPHVESGVLGAVVAELRRLPSEAFLPLAFWLFVRGFPSEPKLPLAQRVADAFVVGSATIGTILFAANVWTSHRSVGLGSSFAATIVRALDRETPTQAYWPLLFLVMGAALPYLVWKLRFETIEARQRGAVFILALAAGITPMLVTVIATPFVPALRDPSLRAVIGWVLYGALISVIPSTAYAVVVKRVMDVHLILRRTSQHALARYAIWLVSVGPLTYMFLDLYLHRGRKEFDLSEQPVLLFLLPLFGFGVLMFRERLLRGVDGWFLRGAVDYAEASARVERGFREARSIREIALLLTREIGRTIHPTRLVVFVADEKTQQLVAIEHTCQPLSLHSVLVELLRQIRRDIQFDPRSEGPAARLLPPTDRAWLLESELTLLCPLLDSGGRLLGMIGMDESQGGLPYTKQDRMFITTMSGHAAMQLEHLSLQEVAGDDRDRTDARGRVAIDWDKEPGAQCPQCWTMWPGNVWMCSCQTPTVPAALPLLVKGKFRVERLIGSGGMGVVYLAVDVTLDRKVAIKTLPNVTPNRVAWLQREARMMASVLHPNLALIYGAEQWRGTPLLIVEYLEGGTLAEHLGRGVLDVAEVIDLGIVLADVLDRVHGSGVLHRDIKPTNIAYTRDGIPKLLDFGVAAIVDRSLSEDHALGEPGVERKVMTFRVDHSQPLQTYAGSSHRLIGTPLYLSPEAVAGEPPQPSIDLWSLSLVLYEGLTGRHPFDGDSVEHVIRRIQETHVPDVRDFRPDCPPELAALLRDSLSPILVRRPATATDLRTRLQRLRRV